jgi:hypothetical protein
MLLIYESSACHYYRASGDIIHAQLMLIYNVLRLWKLPHYLCSKAKITKQLTNSISMMFIVFMLKI